MTGFSDSQSGQNQWTALDLEITSRAFWVRLIHFMWNGLSHNSQDIFKWSFIWRLHFLQVGAILPTAASSWIYLFYYLSLSKSSPVRFTGSKGCPPPVKRGKGLFRSFRNESIQVSEANEVSINSHTGLFECRRGDPYMTANRNFVRFAHS